MLNRQLSNFYMILHPKNHSNSICAKSYDIFLNGMLMTCYQKRYTQLAIVELNWHRLNHFVENQVISI